MNFNRLLLICLPLCFMTSQTVIGQGEKRGTRMLIVVGPSNHPPGSHEVAAGGRLMKYCLRTLREDHIT